MHVSLQTDQWPLWTVRVQELLAHKKAVQRLGKKSKVRNSVWFVPFQVMELCEPGTHPEAEVHLQNRNHCMLREASDNVAAVPKVLLHSRQKAV